MCLATWLWRPSGLFVWTCCPCVGVCLHPRVFFFTKNGALYNIERPHFCIVTYPSIPSMDLCFLRSAILVIYVETCLHVCDVQLVWYFYDLCHELWHEYCSCRGWWRIKVVIGRIKRRPRSRSTDFGMRAHEHRKLIYQLPVQICIRSSTKGIPGDPCTIIIPWWKSCCDIVKLSVRYFVNIFMLLPCTYIMRDCYIHNKCSTIYIWMFYFLHNIVFSYF